MPQSAWNLYFRFRRNAVYHPHLQVNSNELGVDDKEQYKSNVKMMLNADCTRLDNPSQFKYGGCDSFSAMSKNIAREWKQTDAFTRAVFEDLAREDNERHKKVRCSHSHALDNVQRTVLNTQNTTFRRSMSHTKPSLRNYRNLQIYWQ
jgi:hypothetical protein